MSIDTVLSILENALYRKFLSIIEIMNERRNQCSKIVLLSNFA